MSRRPDLCDFCDRPAESFGMSEDGPERECMAHALGVADE